MFDVNSFMSQEVSGSNDTKTVPCPVGDYNAQISKIGVRQWTSKKDPSISGMTLDVTWSIESPEVKALLDRDNVTVRQGIMLDLTDSGGLDMGKGKNVGLGRLREAVNLNDPTRAFAFSQLEGQFALVNVSHRTEGEDIYPEVNKVARLA